MKYRFAFLLFTCTAILITQPAATVPEKPSPMAKLMRDMLQYLKQERANVETGKAPLPYPQQFEKIKTAKLTKGKNPAANHQQYLDGFMQGLNEYYRANKTAERKTAFNNLIRTCVTCHEHECPGPIAPIKDNLIK